MQSLSSALVILLLLFTCCNGEKRINCDNEDSKECEICNTIKEVFYKQYLSEDFIKKNAHIDYSIFECICGFCKINIQINITFGFPWQLYKLEKLGNLYIIDGNAYTLPDWNNFSSKSLEGITLRHVKSKNIESTIILKGKPIQKLKELNLDRCDSVSIDNKINIENMYLTYTSINIGNRIFNGTKKLNISCNNKPYFDIDNINFNFFPDLEELEITTGVAIDSLKYIKKIKKIMEKNKKIKIIQYNGIKVERDNHD